MSQRLVVASLLAIGSGNLHAQNIHPNIPPALDACFRQGSQQAVRDCIGKSWDGSLRQQADKFGGDLRTERTNFSRQMEMSQKQSQDQVTKVRNDYEARIREMLKTQPEMAVLTNKAVLADRVARRDNGDAAIKQFLATFAENLGRDIEFLSVSPAAINPGTVLLRRQAGEPAVLLPFPSLARAYPQEENTRLRFECTPESGACISFVSTDGALSKSGAAWFAVSTTKIATLVQNANLAIDAFK